jgi:CubicO group peptidase (beta-lactamase class C family)
MPGRGYRDWCVRVVATLGCMLSMGAATASELDEYLETVRAQYGLPALAAAVVLNGEIVASAAVGTRVAGRDIPVTLDDRFHIGSNTKSMTATLAGMMVEEGLLSWDSTVGEVLGPAHPGMSDSLAAASLEQLLSHSSGIPTDNAEIIALYFDDSAFDDTPHALRQQLLDQWMHNDLVLPEGSPFQYSNLGYLIAGMMIETASGTPWEQMMHDRIFGPLGMSTAGLGAQGRMGVIDAAVGHRLLADGSVAPMLWGNGADMPTILGPAGNAHMSVLDYAAWAAWNAGGGQRGPDLLSPETLAHIHAEHVQTPERVNPPPGTPTSGGYGLGWGIVQFEWAGRPLLTHNGSNSMNLARILLDIEQDLGIVVFTNFPGPAADSATGMVMAELFAIYGRE